MPTYEYACKACGTHVEVVQSFTDEPLTVCDSCGGELRKVIHPAGILFKGSGFYSTDRRAAMPQTRSRNSDKGDKTDKADKSDKSNGDSSSKSDSSKEAAKGDASKSEPAKNGSGTKSTSAKKTEKSA